MNEATEHEVTEPPLVLLGEGLWCASDPVSVLGMPLTATMSVLRLAGESLLVYSPVGLSAARRAAVDELGEVQHLYVPNLYHHGWAGEWVDAYPAARVHGPAGLASKRPDLRVDRIHGSADEAAFDGVVDELTVEGFRLGESVLHYRPARALVVADLVHNIGRPPQRWTRLYAGAMGFYGRVGLSRMIRWLGFSDRRAARRSLDRILALPFELLVVGHGAPLNEGAREALARAFDWLPLEPSGGTR